MSDSMCAVGKVERMPVPTAASDVLCGGDT